MRTHFTKMHGLGNDFVVFDGIRQSLALTTEQVRRIADRRFGIGCDQVLLVESSSREGVDFRYRIFNADGGEVEQCGNGARCFARFVRDEGLTDKDLITVETTAGIITLAIEADGQVTVDMGPPRFAPQALPFTAEEEQARYRLKVAGEELTFGAVSMGNPHAVVEVAAVASAPVERLGPAIQAHPGFPRGVNVGFMEVVGRDHIRLRVYERGSGETLACGTGACAAVAVGRRWGVLDPTVRVELPGGTLTVRWDDGEAPVWMTGPAARVFKGEIEL